MVTLTTIRGQKELRNEMLDSVANFGGLGGVSMVIDYPFGNILSAKR